ncbi:hypothetical protein GCM10010082_09460 [Kushneria pakistanensis]|uniref:Uncharacterized protein n=1 Tax=Kushneria pakistanensis TaxID=1508770 RepID=A0ABQ3FDT1_9GAMM|nr:hypothetical protein [Kushneria pakistanensis]GHC19820.1 hypothetical protein GCM10010082_09460 [Kushneria pakistanensis]
MIKKLPGMLIGTALGLAIWLPTQSLIPAILLGIASGVAWDLWRKRAS